jgi:hypothetical protein
MWAPLTLFTYGKGKCHTLHPFPLFWRVSLSTYSIKCLFVAVLLERKKAGAQTPLNLHPPPPPPPASSSIVYTTQHHHHLILKNLRIPDLYTFGRIIIEG